MEKGEFFVWKVVGAAISKVIWNTSETTFIFCQVFEISVSSRLTMSIPSRPDSRFAGAAVLRKSRPYYLCNILFIYLSIFVFFLLCFLAGTSRRKMAISHWTSWGGHWCMEEFPSAILPQSPLGLELRQKKRYPYPMALLWPFFVSWSKDQITQEMAAFWRGTCLGGQWIISFESRAICEYLAK